LTATATGTARRCFITQDNDFSRINSQLVEDLGEVNMASGDTLVDFVQWAVTISADKYVLILPTTAWLPVAGRS
jgi:hypothetical protein